VRGLLITLATLSACNHAEKDPVAAAISCVESRVPKGKKVSASAARSVMAACDAEMAAWSRATVERTFDRPLDTKNAEMMERFKLHRDISREKMLLSITDEIQPTFYSL
jgi:hypothetical protein